MMYRPWLGLALVVLVVCCAASLDVNISVRQPDQLPPISLALIKGGGCRMSKSMSCSHAPPTPMICDTPSDNASARVRWPLPNSRFVRLVVDVCSCAAPLYRPQGGSGLIGLRR